jgi:hypothetical protein
LVSETVASLLEWRERWIIRGEKAHEPEFESYLAQRQVYLDRYRKAFLLDLGRFLVHCGGPSYFFIYRSMASGNIPCSMVKLIFGSLKDFKGIKIPDNAEDVVELHAWL